MSDYNVLTDGRDDGALICTSESQKVAFHGATPTSQDATQDDVLSTVVDAVLSTVISTAATSTSPYGYSSAQANAITDVIEDLRSSLDGVVLIVNDMRSTVNAHNDALINKGIIASS